jgi:hypothetical protein
MGLPLAPALAADVLDCSGSVGPCDLMHAACATRVYAGLVSRVTDTISVQTAGHSVNERTAAGRHGKQIKRHGEQSREY